LDLLYHVANLTKIEIAVKKIFFGVAFNRIDYDFGVDNIVDFFLKEIGWLKILNFLQNERAYTMQIIVLKKHKV
tara:strand:+ start:4762 stop:4983 length:222 start_codon:yes stop_codon:yes gene_type:complete